MKILHLFILSAIVGCHVPDNHLQPLEINIHEIKKYKDFLIKKSSCFNNSLYFNADIQTGILIAVITNLEYDTLHVGLSDYLCDSIPIFVPEQIVEYIKTDSTLSMDNYRSIFNNRTKKRINIPKRDSAIIILDSGTFVDSINHVESYYSMSADSSGKDIYLMMKVSRSKGSAANATYFKKPPVEH